MKPLKILFFVNGPAPSAENYAEAATISANVCFRNARCVPADATGLEECDGVTGAVPPVYAAKFPTAEDALEARAEKIKALAEKVGDEAAPKKTAAKADDKAPAKEPASAPAAPAKDDKAPAKAATPAKGDSKPASGDAKGTGGAWKPNA